MKPQCYYLYLQNLFRLNSEEVELQNKPSGPCVLAGRGIGPETAGRILRKQLRDDSDLVKAIIESEITYARTRQFWD